MTGELAVELKVCFVLKCGQISYFEHFPQKMCPMQVFDIEDMGGVPTAVANRPRDCTMCRECIRQDGWSKRIQLRRKADHFVFSVESTGCMAPETIVSEAVSILKDKALKFQVLVEEYEGGHA